jgi:hypothetical protein
MICSAAEGAALLTCTHQHAYYSDRLLTELHCGRRCARSVPGQEHAGDVVCLCCRLLDAPVMCVQLVRSVKLLR